MNFVEQMRKTVNANKEAYPTLSQWTDAMWESPFMVQYLKDTQDLEQGRSVLNVDGKAMGQAVWNLIVSKRDFTMWTKHKMKPTRTWKVNNAKKYFGIRGAGESLMSEFMLVYDVIYNKMY